MVFSDRLGLENGAAYGAQHMYKLVPTAGPSDSSNHNEKTDPSGLITVRTDRVEAKYHSRLGQNAKYQTRTKNAKWQIRL